MRVLLTTSAEKGHLNPLVGVAQWLLRDGHRVGWLTVPEPAPVLREIGVEAVELDLGPHAPPPLVTGGEALAKLVLDEKALASWIRGLLLDAVPAQIEPMRMALRRFAPDVVGLDGMLYQAAIAAHLENLPCVGISSALTLLAPQDLDIALLRTVRSLAADRQSLFERHGMQAEFRTCEFLSPLRNVVFATKAFVGEDVAVPPKTELLGPSRPIAARGDEAAFPWQRLDGRPLVYVSFGSQISWQPDLFRTAATAGAALGAQLVLSAGDLAEDGFASTLPGNPIVVRYAPQLAILEKAAAAVSHGGANSVMEAMDHGVPLLLIPICNDQPVQAHFLAKAGAGLSLAPAEADASRIESALRRLLDRDGELARQARWVGDDYRAQDGACAAAAALVGLARGM